MTSRTRRAILVSAAIGAFVLAAPHMLMAQYGGATYTGHNDNPVGPTVSPYLNLLQNNNQLNPVTNYQSLVRPLVNQQSNVQRQGASIQQLQQQIDSGRSQGQRGTGHASFFMSYSHFYPAPRPQARR